MMVAISKKINYKKGLIVDPTKQKRNFVLYAHLRHNSPRNYLPILLLYNPIPLQDQNICTYSHFPIALCK